MKSLGPLIGSMLVTTVLAFALPASAQVAQGPSDQMTYVTFNKPFELPGVALPAGTYIFRLPDRPGARHVVQVLSADRSTVYAMVQAVPRTGTGTNDRVMATFKEASPTTPPAIRTWFFARDPVGLEFMYPKEQARRIAQRTHERVLTEDMTYVE